MSKHSPGPWRWESDVPYANAILRAADGSKVCDFGGGMKWEEVAGDEPDEPDARLIAAAPRMLELLREFVIEYADMCRGSDTVDKARILIARIDGET